jgi:hypothetical protein
MPEAPHRHAPSDPKLPRRIKCPRCRGAGNTFAYCIRCGGKRSVIVLETISAEPGSLLHPIRRLSRLQKWILRKLGKFGEKRFGVSMKLLRKRQPKTPANNAAFARALARLEKRRLVIRTNHRTGIPGLNIIRTKASEPPVKRTSHVILTPLGRHVADLLRQFPERGRRSSPIPA